MAECIEELLAVFVRVIGVEADAKQASIGRYGRWANGGNEDPCIEEFFREFESFVGVMDVEGNDRSGVAGGTESSQGEFFAEKGAKFEQFKPLVVHVLDQLDRLCCGSEDRRWEGGREDQGSGAVQEGIAQQVGASDVASGASDGFAQGAGFDPDRAVGSMGIEQPSAAAAEDTRGVGFVGDRKRVEFAAERLDLANWANMSIHAKEGVGQDVGHTKAATEVCQQIA